MATSPSNRNHGVNDSPNHRGPAPERFGFLLVPNYSFIAFAVAIEALRMANRLADQDLYAWRTLTIDGNPVAASNGIVLQPDGTAPLEDPPDALFVCAGIKVEIEAHRALITYLRGLGQRKLAVGALCTGSYLLARAGLLNGYRATIHWENLAMMHDEFPHLIVSSELFEIDRNRYTCSGGTAPLDMMLTLIRHRHGAELASLISETFICDRIRGRNDRQRVPLRHTLGTGQPKLSEAVALMESNLEEPISLDELAHHVGISRRQLERLFQKHLNCVPTRYYLELRLRRARQLLLNSDRSIVDIALACGFVSAPHFSKCYRDFFGVPPREDRRLQDARITAGG